MEIGLIPGCVGVTCQIHDGSGAAGDTCKYTLNSAAPYDVKLTTGGGFYT